MDNMEFIENYFNGINDDAQKKEFEKKIMEDPSFAEDVAFYISTQQVLRESIYEEKKIHFKEIYNRQKTTKTKSPVRYLWKYVAAASVIIAVVLITWLSFNKKSLQQLADNYINQNFKTIGVSMGDKDSLQSAFDLFNANKMEQALNIFEQLSKNNPQNTEAIKYAGVVYLRLGNYDKAVQDFTILANDTSLYSNPGKFYEAITLLKRNKTGDKDSAEELLNEVVKQNLEGKADAEDILKKL